MVRVFRGAPCAVSRRVPLKSFAICTAIRVLLTVFRPRQIQSLLPQSSNTYQLWLADKRKREQKQGRALSTRQLSPDIESLPGTDASIMWIGDRDTATRFVLFLHGGGYVVPLTPGHLEWCWDAYVAGLPPAQGCAVAVVQYTLAPASRQPTQLREAAAALQHLLDTGVRPANLIVGGDSAGGNLAVQLVRHLIRPHPHVAPVSPAGDSSLAGVFLVSPLVGGDTTTQPSLGENDVLDLLGEAVISRLKTELLGQHHPPDPAAVDALHQVDRDFASPLDGDLGWLDDWSSATRATYITAGKQEVCRDGIVAFGDGIRARNPGHHIVLEVPETELHGAILLEGQDQKPGDAIRRMRDWAQAQL